jgi:hypothetical protein
MAYRGVTLAPILAVMPCNLKERVMKGFGYMALIILLILAFGLMQKAKKDYPTMVAAHANLVGVQLTSGYHAQGTSAAADSSEPGLIGYPSSERVDQAVGSGLHWYPEDDTCSLKLGRSGLDAPGLEVSAAIKSVALMRLDKQADGYVLVEVGPVFSDQLNASSAKFDYDQLVTEAEQMGVKPGIWPLVLKVIVVQLSGVNEDNFSHEMPVYIIVDPRT